MAGEFVSASIPADSGNKGGHCIDIVVNGDVRAGFALDPGSVPSLPNITLTVTSQGYNSSGVLGTTTRTVYGVEILRQVLLTAAQVTYSDPNTTITVALSEPIYNDDTVVLNTNDSWFNSTAGLEGTSGPEIINESVTNNSDLDYGKVVGRWTRVPYDIVGDPDFPSHVTQTATTIELACYCASIYGISKVDFEVKDSASPTPNVRNATTSTLVKSSEARNGLYWQEYKVTINIEGLQDGELECNFKAYPVVGDENSTLDTRTTADGTQPPHGDIGPLFYYNNAGGTFGVSYAVVDYDNGDDGTATVSGSRSTALGFAAANRYATLAAAINACKSFNNTNYSRNERGGSVIFIVDPASPGKLWTLNNGNVSEGILDGNGQPWLVIMPHPTLGTRERVVFSGNNGGNGNWYSGFVRMYNCTIGAMGNLNMFGLYEGSGNESGLHIMNCNLSGLVTGQIGGWSAGYITDCYLDNTCNPEGINPGSGNDPFPLYLCLGNEWQQGGTIGGQPTDNVKVYSYAHFANKQMSTTWEPSSSALPYTTMDNLVIGWNECLHISNSNNAKVVSAFLEFATTAGETGIVHGCVIVGNVAESIYTVSQPIFTIAGSGEVAIPPTQNTMVWHNTFIGERTNVFYNQVNTRSLQVNHSWIGNIFGSLNSKGDGFVGGQVNETGNFGILYGTGFFYNRRTVSSSSGAFENYGIGDAFDNTLGFTDDKSGSSGAGNGNYLPAEGSDLIGAIPSSYVKILYDLYGNQFSGSNSIGAVQLVTQDQGGGEEAPPRGTSFIDIDNSSQSQTLSSVPLVLSSKVKKNETYLSFTPIADPHTSTTWQFRHEFDPTSRIRVQFTTNSSGVTDKNNFPYVTLAGLSYVNINLDRQYNWYVRIKENNGEYSDWVFIDLSGEIRLVGGNHRDKYSVSNTERGKEITPINPQFTIRNTNRGKDITKNIYRKQQSRDTNKGGFYD